MAIAMVGCGDDDTGTEDTGTADTGTPDAGEDTNVGEDTNPPPEDTGGMAGAACDSIRTEALTMGDQTLTGNTADGGTLAMMPECGGPDAGTMREVIALEVPGSGELGFTFDSGTDVTGEADTVVQFRTAGCDDETDAQCFDDPAAGVLQSAGALTVTGGETIYMIVTTYAEGTADAPAPGTPAAWSMDVTLAPAVAPVLTGGSAVLVDGDVIELTMMGTDEGGDVVGVAVTFLDDAGDAIEVDEDGDPETPETITEFEFGLNAEPDISGMTTFTAESFVSGLSDVAELEGFAGVRVGLIDSFDLRSETMDFTPSIATTVGLDDACDGEATRCPDTLECIADTCQAPAAVTEACDAVTPITLTAGTPVTETVSVAAGEGIFGGSCGSTGGAEALLAVTVPAGSFDLEVTTDNETNGLVEDLDTVLYLRTACADDASEPEAEDAGCNDDIESGNTLSTLTIEEAPEGTHTVFVELYGGIEEGGDAQDVEVTISLTAR